MKREKGKGKKDKDKGMETGEEEKERHGGKNCRKLSPEKAGPKAEASSGNFKYKGRFIEQEIMCACWPYVSSESKSIVQRLNESGCRQT